MDHSDDFYFTYIDGKLYVRGDNTTEFGNGVFNKEIVDAILPRTFKGTRVYGTGYRSLSCLKNLETVFIPNTYRYIEADTFLNSFNLREVTFEDNYHIKYIWFWLLHSTLISTFTIPHTVKDISLNSTFFNCTKLKSIYYQGMLKLDSDEGTFKNVPNDLKIYVRIDYPYDQIGGRAVTKVLPAPIKITMKNCHVNHRFLLLRLGFNNILLISFN